MYVPQWLAAILVGAIGIVIWWGVLRFIKINDDTNKNLECIDTNLGKINERLGKTEVWMVQHEKQDDDKFEVMKDETEVVWRAIDKIRNT